MGKRKKPVGFATPASRAADGVEPLYKARFRRLERLVQLAVEQKVFSVFLTSQPGLGKSTAVIRALTKLGLTEPRDFKVIKGHTSGLGLYQSLWGEQGGRNADVEPRAGGTEQRKRLLIFDDCDAVFSTMQNVNVLRACLDDKETRMVSWVSSKLPPGIPSSFPFTGSVVFISNLPIDAVDDAVISRSHTVDLTMDRDTLYLFIENEVIDAPHLMTTKAQRHYVFRRMKAALTHSPTPASVRLYKKLLDCFCHDRPFFDEHCDALMPRSDELTMVRRLLDRHDTVGEAAKAYASATGKSERTFYLVKAKYARSL